jgi:hypothetical protein
MVASSDHKGARIKAKLSSWIASTGGLASGRSESLPRASGFPELWRHLRRPNILAPYDLGRDRLKDRPSLVWLKLISLAETSSVARESL